MTRHQRTRLRSATLVTAGLVTGLVTAVPATAAPPPAAGDAITAHTVTLITGDRVLVRESGGRPSVVAVPRPGSTGTFLAQQAGGDLYVIPAAAFPYLGSSLDRSLFDVSALIRDGFADNAQARTPVEIASSGAAIPGVVPTGPASGYVTAGSAAQFGTALARQAGADAAKHFAHAGALFGGVSSVRLAAPGAPARAVPHYPMHTVRFTTLDATGQPGAASLGVGNTDDGSRYFGFPQSAGGDARISVPDGHYNAVALVPTFDAQGNAVGARMVTTDFTVQGTDTAVTIDARKATSQVSVTTPRPSTPDNVSLTYDRADAKGNLTIGNQFFVGTGAVYVQPSGPSAIGRQYFNVALHSVSPTGLPEPYTYDVKLDNGGAIAADQHYRVTAGQLATLKETYYSDQPNRAGGSGRILALPYEGLLFGTISPLTAPLRRTEYLGGSDGLVASGLTLADYPHQMGFVSDGDRVVQPGSTSTVDWLRGPLAPGIAGPTDPAEQYACAACRQGDTLGLHLTPAIDSAGHLLSLDPPGNGVVSTSHFQLFADGKSLLDAKDVVGGTIPAPAQQAAYRLVYDQTRTAPWFHQSTVSHTEWTFASAHSGTKTVPDNWLCQPGGTAADCSALPLITANYQLGTGIDGTIPAGPDQLQLTLAHAPGADTMPLTKASVDVSFDNGTHWTPTAVADLGTGHYRARWTNPAGTGDVALRITATDVAGGTFTQTVTGALTVTGA